MLTEKLRPQEADAFVVQPPNPNFRDGETVDVFVSEAPIPSEKKKRRISPFTEFTQNTILDLSKLDRDGKPIYTGFRDPNLIRKVLEVPPGVELKGRSLEMRTAKIRGARDNVLKRFKQLKMGESDPSAKELLSKIRGSHEKYRILDDSELIDLLTELLNRQSPPKKHAGKPAPWSLLRSRPQVNGSVKKTTGNGGSSLLPTSFEFRETSSLGSSANRVIFTPRVNPKPPEKSALTNTTEKPKPIDLETVPIPKARGRERAYKSPGNEVVYSLMLISQSRTSYEYPDVRSIVLDFFGKNIEKFPSDQREEQIDALVKNAEGYLEGFKKGLRDFKNRDSKEETDIRSSEVGLFVLWAERQAVYQTYCIEDLISVMERKITSDQVIYDYFEFQETTRTKQKNNGKLYLRI